MDLSTNLTICGFVLAVAALLIHHAARISALETRLDLEKTFGEKCETLGKAIAALDATLQAAQQTARERDESADKEIRRQGEEIARILPELKRLDFLVGQTSSGQLAKLADALRAGAKNEVGAGPKGEEPCKEKGQE